MFDGTYPHPEGVPKVFDARQRNGTIKADKEVCIIDKAEAFPAWTDRLIEYRADMIRAGIPLGDTH